MAVKQALSDMIVNSGLGKISVIDFELGPPHGGRLSFRLVVDGCCMPLCEPNDAYPFLESLRDWMERSLVCDKEGTLHPEILTIDCTEAVYSVILFQAGWIGVYAAGALRHLQERAGEQLVFVHNSIVGILELGGDGHHPVEDALLAPEDRGIEITVFAFDYGLLGCSSLGNGNDNCQILSGILPVGLPAINRD